LYYEDGIAVEAAEIVPSARWLRRGLNRVLPVHDGDVFVVEVVRLTAG
jgi:hypothetical protein